MNQMQDRKIYEFDNDFHLFGEAEVGAEEGVAAFVVLAEDVEQKYPCE